MRCFTDLNSLNSLVQIQHFVLMDEMNSRRRKKPWPTKAAMEQVYELNLWGGEEGEFNSGFGAHDPELVQPYIEAVSSFLWSLEQPPMVCDLGCGDFNVGKELVQYSEKYIAVDIAENLIQRNKETFNDEKLEFRCLDIAKDELPNGEVAILRHVLQHLSNEEVQKILKKLSSFKYVIITEHIPVGEFEPNKDIISGQGTRLKKRSGLDLFEEPFHFKAKSYKELVAIPDDHGIIQTRIYALH